MTDEALLKHVPADKDHIFPMYQDGILPEDYAKVYEKQIRKVLGEEGIFDFILLGMGMTAIQHPYFPVKKFYRRKKNG